MHYFYAPGEHKDSISLSKEESHHAFRVLRLQPGDEVGVFNGSGSIFTCEVSEIRKNHCELRIRSVESQDKNEDQLEVYIAPTKSNDRFEWFLEKATEIGVARIQPIHCEHSERNKIRHDRMEKVLIAAMKQSMNPFLPEFADIITFKEAIEACDTEQSFIAHCYEGDKKPLYSAIKQKSCSIFIGPEGDFSKDEIDLALSNGMDAITLGKSRLRTETAGIAAVHTYALKMEELK